MRHGASPVEVFIGYAGDGQDKQHCAMLEKHLSVPRRQSEIVTRHERLVAPGKELHAELQGMLDRADLIVLLITPDFIASDFCYHEQMNAAISRHNRHSARVIPVIVRPCDLEGLPVAKLKALPTTRKPITDDRRPERIWAQVAREIRAVAKELQERQSSKEVSSLSNATDSAPNASGSPAVEPPSTLLTPQARAKQVVRTLESVQAKEDPAELLRDWVLLFGPTPLDRDILQFICGEVALRSRETARTWQRRWAELISLVLRRGMPIDELSHRIPYSEEVRQARNAGEALLALAHACALVSKEQVLVNWPQSTAFRTWVQELLGQREGPDSPLVLACLGYLDVSGQDLRMFDFSGAKLSMANLSGADLTAANLQDADLRGADLEKAQLERADLRGADLSDASLRSAYVSSANLAGANLAGTNLEDAELYDANLEDANLEDANLEGANLIDAEFEERQLRTTRGKPVVGQLEGLDRYTARWEWG